MVIPIGTFLEKTSRTPPQCGTAAHTWEYWYWSRIVLLVQEADKKIDEESRRGRFGWCEFEKNYIPYIFRTGKGEKYTSVRQCSIWQTDAAC